MEPEGLAVELLEACPLGDTDPLALTEGETAGVRLGEPLLEGAPDSLTEAVNAALSDSEAPWVGVLRPDSVGKTEGGEVGGVEGELMVEGVSATTSEALLRGEAEAQKDSVDTPVAEAHAESLALAVALGEAVAEALLECDAEPVPLPVSLPLAKVVTLPPAVAVSVSVVVLEKTGVAEAQAVSRAVRDGDSVAAMLLLGLGDEEDEGEGVALTLMEEDSVMGALGVLGADCETVAAEEGVPSAPEALGLPVGGAVGAELSEGGAVGALLWLVEDESLGEGGGGRGGCCRGCGGGGGRHTCRGGGARGGGPGPREGDGGGG